MADLKDRVIVLIGTGSVLDRGVAEGLAEAGASLYLARPRTGSGSDPADSDGELETALNDLGGTGRVVGFDPASEESLKRLFRRVEAEAGQLDVLVSLSALGLGINEGPFWEQTLDDWDDHGAELMRNLLAASSLGARLMIPARRGFLVQVVPGASGTSVDGLLLAGLEAMTVRMARAFVGTGVGALVLDPGLEFAAHDREAAASPSPRLLGRCLAALAMDPDVLEKTGACHSLQTLKREYRFAELGEDP